MQVPMLSVVVALYQVEDLLPVFLDSLSNLMCDEPRIEAILVDDGSTDNSGQLAREFVEQHPNSRLIKHGQNKGLFCARQTGVFASNGNFVWLVDGDDVLLKLDFEFIKQSMISHPELDIFCFQFVETRNSSIPAYTKDLTLKRYKSVSHGWILFPLIYCGNIWRFMIRRDLASEFYRTTLMQNDMGEDLVLTSWLGANTHLAMLADLPIYLYRRHRPGSYTGALQPYERISTSIELFHQICVENTNNLDPATRSFLALFSLPMRDGHRMESARMQRQDMVAKCRAIDDIVPNIDPSPTKLAELIEQQSIGVQPAVAKDSARRILECLEKDITSCSR